MGRSRNLTLAFAAIAIALAALPAAASAATVVPVASGSKAATPTAPLATGPFDAQIWPAQDGKVTAAIIDVNIDNKVKLPVRVRIPVPQGAVVQWAGEILGGDPSADPERTFTLHSGAGGGQYAEITLTAAHRGQIDTNGIPMTATGNKISTQVDWIQSVPSTSTIFSVRVPAGVSDIKIDPTPQGTPQVNSAGETLWVLPVATLAPGAPLTITISYNATPTGATAPPRTNLTVVYILLGVLLVGAVGFAAYLLLRSNSGNDGEDDDDDGGYDDDSSSSDASSDSEAADDTDEDDDPFDVGFDD